MCIIYTPLESFLLVNHIIHLSVHISPYDVHINDVKQQVGVSTMIFLVKLFVHNIKKTKKNN